MVCIAAVCIPAAYIYDLLPFGTDDSDGPLVIKAEDFGIFLFESSEEIYRANVKDPDLWAELRENALVDREYEQHYLWLYDAYNSWDAKRRNQLKTIMTTYEPHDLVQSMVAEGKHNADFDEILRFMRDNWAYREQNSLLIDFYKWYGENYARPHYQQIKPSLQRKVDVTMGMVEQDFDIIKFMENETGVKREKKYDQMELQLSMRIIGMSVYSQKRDTITTVQWNRSPEKIWTAVFNEFSTGFLNSFTDSLSFRNMTRKLKRDNTLMVRYNENIPYSWEGWIDKNLAEGFAHYLVSRKGISKDLKESTYVFDREYAQALYNGFDPAKGSLKNFTTEFLKKNYKI